MKNNKITATICLVVALAIAGVTGMNFMSLKDPGAVYPTEGAEMMMLSTYFDGLEGTNMDTEVYVFEGENPGGKVLIIGGTHPNEPASAFTAITMLETIDVTAGTVYVIPYANNSAFTHNDAQEASPQYLHINTESGERIFRYGSRATNPIDQWPDPDVYTHAASGQQLSGSETRNLNRAYPGRPDGTPTEQLAYAITEMIKTEDIGLTFDLHEASPEYPVINAAVSHEKGMSVAASAIMNMQFAGISIALEPSPVNLRGLTHRELGDYTDTIPILFETANASQGRLRGATSEYQALTGKDKAYEAAEPLGFLYVPYDESGHSIEERVGRHLQGIHEFVNAYNTQYPDLAVTYEGVPTYQEIYVDAPVEDLGGVHLGKFLK